MPTSNSALFAQSRPRLALLLAALAYVIRRLWANWRSKPSCPIATTFPLLGSLPSFIEAVKAAARNENLDYYVRMHKENGRTCSFRPPGQNWWVLTTKPENVEHMLSTNFANYPKGKFFTGPCKELLGDGIFNADGQLWQHQRKTASHMFTAKLFKDHIWFVVQRNAIKLRALLSAAEGGEPVDIFNFMNRFTLDTIGEIGFGKSIGSLDDPTSPFLRSFDRAQQITFWRFWFPIYPLLKFFKLGFESDSREHLSRLDAYSRDVGRELRKTLSESSSSETSVEADCEAKKSFVGLFLQDGEKRGEDTSDTYIRDLVLNFLIAGRDTTAQALSWTIFVVSQHPEVETKLRQEIVDVCGTQGPSYEDMKEAKRLPYLHAVLHEVMRLYPSVPVDVKMCIKEDVWPDGTRIAANTTCAYNIYGMARDVEVWGDDAAEFKPDRWLAMETAPDNYKYPVFNAGPRECLGRRLALVEMKACLAMLLPKYSFKLAVPASDIKPDAQLTIGMSSGLPCYVLPVKSA